MNSLYTELCTSEICVFFDEVIGAMKNALADPSVLASNTGAALPDTIAEPLTQADTVNVLLFAPVTFL